MRHEIDVTELLNRLPRDVKKKLIVAIERLVRKESDKEPSNYEMIKNWLEQYDDDMIDNFVAKIGAQVITDVGHHIHKAVKASKSDGLCGILAGRILVERVRFIADRVEKSINEAEQDEGHNDCKHS